MLSKSELEEIETEYEEISNDQNEDVVNLRKKRKDTLKKISKDFIKEYNRVREHTKDSAVRIRRNSCSGCFSAQPPQKIVEIRNNLDQLFFCENCGRILYPEDINIEDSMLYK